MKMAKTGKIIKIIDGTHVVINIGSYQGVKKDTVFRIFASTGEEVKDPDTGDILGTLNSYKGKVITQVVYEHMTVCTSVPTNLMNNTLNRGLLSPIHPELNVDPDEITGGFSEPKNTTIKIGDTVEQDLG